MLPRERDLSAENNFIKHQRVPYNARTPSPMLTFLWVQGIISSKTGLPSDCAHCLVHREEVKDSSVIPNTIGQ